MSAYFVSPKINSKPLAILESEISRISNFLKKESICCKIELVSNDQFQNEILEPITNLSKNIADTSELFLRSVQLVNLFQPVKKPQKERIIIKTNQPEKNKNSEKQNDKEIANPVSHLLTEQDPAFAEYVKIGTYSIPTLKEHAESVQDYVKKIMRILLNNKILDSSEMEKLQDKGYCKQAFKLQFPLIKHISEGYKDNTGRGRYWSKETFGGEFYVCSQWWKDHHPTYLLKLKQWLLTLQE